MDIPKGFRPEKKDKERLEHMLNTDSKPVADALLKHFLDSKDYVTRNLDAYNLSEELDIKYSKEDLTELSSNIIEDVVLAHWFGSYLSALVNRIITKNDKIILKPRMKLDWIGTMFEKGTLVVEASVGSHAGDSMRGGSLIIEGNAGDYTGIGIAQGLIEVKGYIGDDTGVNSSGGMIKTHKGVKSIGANCYVWIYKKEVRIWPTN